MPLFSVVTRFDDTIGKPDFDKTSEHFQAAKLRDTLQDCARALAQTGRVHALDANPALRGKSLIDALMTDLDKLLDRAGKNVAVFDQ